MANFGIVPAIPKVLINKRSSPGAKRRIFILIDTAKLIKDKDKDKEMDMDKAKDINIDKDNSQNQSQASQVSSLLSQQQVWSDL